MADNKTRIRFWIIIPSILSILMAWPTIYSYIYRLRRGMDVSDHLTYKLPGLVLLLVVIWGVSFAVLAIIKAVRRSKERKHKKLVPVLERM